MAFAAADLDWRDCVEIKNPFSSGTEAHPRKGNITRAKTKLLWEPEVSFEEMINMMVEADIARHSLKNRLRSEPIAHEHWQGSLS
jgi:GDPmannose 4,6-dehydratase